MAEKATFSEFPSITRQDFSGTTRPSDELLNQLVAFDQLCFAGTGSTTSPEHAPPLLTVEDILGGLDLGNTFVVGFASDNSIAYVVQTVVRNKLPNNESDLHLMSMAVAPRFRGQGVGRVLIERVVYQVAREQGINIATLRVDPSNTPAVRLYLREGFVVVGGRSKSYSGHPKVVTLAASKRLDASPSFTPADSMHHPVVNFSAIDAGARAGLVGVALHQNGMLEMKALTQESQVQYPHWN